jgi:hypothetical protein
VPELAADHDGRIVADEWAERHQGSYRLELTGPAGGVFARDDAPALVMDAVDFCRAVRPSSDHPGRARAAQHRRPF